MDSMTREVINPLISFKVNTIFITTHPSLKTPLGEIQETQDRIRKRIRNDMKESIQTHADYEETTLPKLKRSYFKKCQDVEVRARITSQ